MNDLILSVSDFVAVFNQTLEYTYPDVVIVGELANFRVCKNRWVYFDLKDDSSSVKFFGTVYSLPGPLEDGMMMQVRGVPRLHNLYGFSVNVQTIQPVGEGTIKKAAALLEAKLAAEGLFDDERKRLLPYPPTKIGLITSGQSAAYADFIKIINERWGGVHIHLADVQVQGEVAPQQIVNAIQHFNASEELVDVLVVTRGGGSAEDLSAFSTEQVTRAVAASRIPTLVAIGHEIDISLAELAADRRASTPSNAAQILVPDKHQVLMQLGVAKNQMLASLQHNLGQAKQQLVRSAEYLQNHIDERLQSNRHALTVSRKLLEAYSPLGPLQRGYALVKSNGKIIRNAASLKTGSDVVITFKDGDAHASISSIKY